MEHDLTRAVELGDLDSLRSSPLSSPALTLDPDIAHLIRTLGRRWPGFVIPERYLDSLRARYSKAVLVESLRQLREMADEGADPPAGVVYLGAVCARVASER